MDLQSVTIENFKCFQAQSEIEFGKLTLLTGANSSGKSSIIYSVLGAIQSGEFPFQFSTNGKYVNMGDYKEVVNNHNRKEKIKIGFNFRNATIKTVETTWSEDINNLPKLNGLIVDANDFDLFIKLAGGKYKVDFQYDPKKDRFHELTSSFITKIEELMGNTFKVDTEGKNNEENAINIESYITELNSSQNIKGVILDEIPDLRKDISKKGIIRLQRTFDLISQLFNSYDEEINFISSFRLHPERSYFEQTKSKFKVNNYGDGYLDQIIYWETKNKTKFNELIGTLKKLGLLENIKSKRLDGGRFEMSVQVKKNGIHASLSDVGFGISQFLPIIVADLQLPDGSTLFVAQPEIHLHPSVQSSFGDYLVEQINSKSKNYVVETHSEYLLNKIRLAIVKNEIAEDDVKIMFVDNETGQSIVHKITFNKKGQIVGAPDNFFKTYMMDVMDIAINAAEQYEERPVY